MGPFIFRKICTSYSESGERNDALSTDRYESTLLTFQFYISKEETNMKNKTLKFEVPEEIKERLRAVVKKQEEIEEMDGKIKVKKKRNWKKIAAYTAAGLAVVGAGIAIAVKLKNGDDISDDCEALVKNTNFGVCDSVSLSVFGDGVGYDADMLTKEGNIVFMGVQSMSLQDMDKMFELINPDVYGISNETTWDEILLIQH